jgi:hypothetical protein
VTDDPEHGFEVLLFVEDGWLPPVAEMVPAWAREA